MNTISNRAGVATTAFAMAAVIAASLRGLGVGGTLILINGRRAGLSPISTGHQPWTTWIESTSLLKCDAHAMDGD